jgi:hypothetical protein
MPGAGSCERALRGEHDGHGGRPAASLRYNRPVGRRVAAAALIVEGDSPCVYLVSPP